MSEDLELERTPLQVVHPGANLAIANAPTPAGMLAYAMSKDVDIEKLERLYALQQQWEKDEARRQYHQALAEFKAQPLSITKDRRVFFKGKDGKPDTEFYHATLGNVVAVIAPALGRHQLSHSWTPKREGDRVFVTCRLTHALGHSEEITLDGPLDSTGSKNNIQAVGSTITYLERYTLLAITGLATEDQEDADDRQPEDPHALSVRDQWLDAINLCTTVDEYQKLKTELAASAVGGKDRDILREAFKIKWAKLQQAIADAKSGAGVHP